MRPEPIDWLADHPFDDRCPLPFRGRRIKVGFHRDLRCLVFHFDAVGPLSKCDQLWIESVMDRTAELLGYDRWARREINHGSRN